MKLRLHSLIWNINILVASFSSVVNCSLQSPIKSRGNISKILFFTKMTCEVYTINCMVHFGNECNGKNYIYERRKAKITITMNKKVKKMFGNGSTQIWINPLTVGSSKFLSGLFNNYENIAPIFSISLNGRGGG